MDPNLRLAWTEIVSAKDYDQHMAAIGQAQAAAELTRFMIENTAPPEAARLVIAGAGTGQMFEYLEPELFRPFQLTCTDLNRLFLTRLKQRLVERGLRASIAVDDIERTALRPGPDLLLATLVLEHIDWLRGVEAIAQLRPKSCGIVIQENPPGMPSAVTPNRPIPPSIEKAVEIAHPTLVPRSELIIAFKNRGYDCRAERDQEVADRKRLIALLFCPVAR